MKKSTILLIFIIYLASIVAVGFFGMASKVYDETKYVSLIEMSAQVENPEMMVWEDITESPTSKEKEYFLTVNFDKAILYKEDKYFVPITLIPFVSYDTGDVANSKEESIVYSSANAANTLKDSEGNISFLKNGEIIAYLTKQGALSVYAADCGFVINVSPVKQGSAKVGATIFVTT